MGQLKVYLILQASKWISSVRTKLLFGWPPILDFMQASGFPFHLGKAVEEETDLVKAGTNDQSMSICTKALAKEMLEEFKASFGSVSRGDC